MPMIVVININVFRKVFHSRTHLYPCFLPSPLLSLILIKIKFSALSHPLVNSTLGSLDESTSRWRRGRSTFKRCNYSTYPTVYVDVRDSGAVEPVCVEFSKGSASQQTEFLTRPGAEVYRS